MKAQPRPHRTSVSGTHYVLHLDLGNGRTACGRKAAQVNCTTDPTAREELCQTCARCRLAVRMKPILGDSAKS